MEKLKIFISGTQDDMKPERDAVDRAVSSTMLSTGIRAETAVSQLKPPRAWIEQQIHECNIYIGVYSHRYGWVIPEENVSATEFEFNLARKLGKPVLVWIRKLRDEEKSKPNIDRQEQFLIRVSDFSTGHLRQEFDNPADLEKWVAAALGETFTEIIRRGTAPNTSKFLVPFPHNPDFVGRDAELISLHEMLQHGGSIVGIRPTVLVGLGGIGKTQLAVEYAHAHRDDYPNGVFWLNAINPLLIEFSDLAEKLEMSDRDTPRDKAARKAWDYLDTHSDALVIFDNVLEPSELNVPFSPDLVPANLRCRTLFTTRQRDFPRTFQPFEVKVLPEMAAMNLLLRSRPEVLEEHHPEWGWARIVCAYLGWLPLALELAAAYLGAYPEVSITGYLERLRTEGSLETVDASEVRAVDLHTRVEEILKAAAAGNLEFKHQVAVSATLQTQWKRLDDEDARLLFRAAGQFPETSWIPIPRLGLLTGIENEAKAGRPSPLNVVLKKLHAVSLIEELTDDRLRLHPLVQEFAARLSPAPTSFRMEMAERVATEFDDLMRLQARVIGYGIDMVLEDLRTALDFCIEQKATDTYFRISKMERLLDRQAHGLRNWNAQEEPVLFLQSIRNEAFVQNFKQWQKQAETELAHLKKPYLLERFPISSHPAELRTLVGHNDAVTSVALSADGRLAVSASLDMTLKVWDVVTGRELHTLTGHRDAVSCVALSADGRLAISVSVLADLKVWDVPTGRELRTILTGQKMPTMGVALSADGRLAVSASDDKTLKVWDVSTGRELRTIITGHSGTVDDVVLSADGTLAISASNDTLKVWDIATGRDLAILNGHSERVNSVALNMDGRLAVSASDDHTLKVWDVTTGHELRTLTGHTHYVKGVALSADGRLAVSVSVDKTLKVWDVTTGRELSTITSNCSAGLALSADGRLAVFASKDQTINVWDVSAALALNDTSLPYRSSQEQHDRQCKEVERLNASVETVQNPYTLTRHSSNVECIALSADGRLAVSASNDHTLKVWDVTTGHELRTLTGYSQYVQGVALSVDGQLAVSASKDQTVNVWDVTTGRQLHILKGYKCVSLSADGQLAVTPFYSTALEGEFEFYELKILDVKTGLEVRTFKGHDTWVNGVVLSADGRVAISASDDRTLKVWDVSTGRELRTFNGHSDKVNSVALSVDGRVAVSASDDRTLKVWDVSTGRELRTFNGHSGKVNSLAINADGRLAASASDDRTLKVWGVESGHSVATLLVGVSLTCCAMSADGKTIVAGDRLGGIHFLELIGADELLAKDTKI